MHLTQSAATKMLQDTEEALGAALFDRSARGLAATPLGRHVVAYARQVITQTERMADETGGVETGSGGAVELINGGETVRLPSCDEICESSCTVL